jgi:hypothetical protein
VSVECVPAPTNCDTWYRGPVTVRWSIPFATGASPGCLPRILQNDTAGQQVVCTAWEGSEASGSTTASVVIRIDSTPPTVTAATDRPPDFGSWFNHPLGVAFHGTDATSGVASCGTGSYGGPDNGGATVFGSCRDVAGNVGVGSLSLSYDATPPAAPKVEARPDDNAVELDWSAPPDAQTVEVVRLAPQALVFQGQGDEVTDRRLRNGSRYRYSVAAVDQAGNRAQTTVSAVPTASRLLLPARRAHLGDPPLLVWEALKRATYYNVQLYRGSRKILSRWPRAAQLQLDPSWRYLGRRRRLTPGLYRWFVWPGFGERSERRYGKRLGRSSFTIVD